MASRLPRDRGSQAHDALRYAADDGVIRDTNRAGGLEGGMSNGETLVVRAAMKPIPTLMTPLASFDLDSTQRRTRLASGPTCARSRPRRWSPRPRWPSCLRTQYAAAKFGGDCVSDMVAAVAAYRSSPRCESRPSHRVHGRREDARGRCSRATDGCGVSSISTARSSAVAGIFGPTESSTRRGRGFREAEHRRARFACRCLGCRGGIAGESYSG